MTVGATL